MKRLLGAAEIRLDDDHITQGEARLQAMVFHANSLPLSRGVLPCAANERQSNPAIRVDSQAVAFANETVSLEADAGVRGFSV